jgi:hypothetical protein
MKISVDPPLGEPVERALAELLRDVPPHRIEAWREAALREGVERGEPEEDYALSPRSTRGATRA